MVSSKRYLIAVLMLLWAAPASAQLNANDQSIVNLRANSFNATIFASLNDRPPQTNGTITYCGDCAATNPCTGGGTGAIAERLANTWACANSNTGSSSNFTTTVKITPASTTANGLDILMPVGSTVPAAAIVNGSGQTILGLGTNGLTQGQAQENIPLDAINDGIDTCMDCNGVSNTIGNAMVNFENGNAASQVVSVISKKGQFFSEPADPTTIPFLANSPSGQSANLLDLMVNGVHKFTVSPAGVLTSGSLSNSQMFFNVQFGGNSTTPILGVWKTANSITIQSAQSTCQTLASCGAGGATYKLWDCGTTAASAVTCAAGTALATVATGTTTNLQVDQTVNSPSVAAGHYLSWQLTNANSCNAALTCFLNATAQ